MEKSENGTQERVGGGFEFVERVYRWLLIGIAVTIGAALAIAYIPLLPVGPERIVLILVAVVLKFLIPAYGFARRNVLDWTLARVLFVLYAVANGITVASLFDFFEVAALAATFVLSVAAFGAATIYGYSTRTDLSKGYHVHLAVFMLFLGLVLNIFFQAQGLAVVFSVVGVVIYCGLAACEAQKTKCMGLVGFQSPQEGLRLSIFQAFQLYVGFDCLFGSLFGLFARFPEPEGIWLWRSPRSSC